jgi:hypothetical protein
MEARHFSCELRGAIGLQSSTGDRVCLPRHDFYIELNSNYLFNQRDIMQTRVVALQHPGG